MSCLPDAGHGFLPGEGQQGGRSVTRLLKIQSGVLLKEASLFTTVLASTADPCPPSSSGSRPPDGGVTAVGNGAALDHTPAAPNWI
ncbi:hypothetical protein ACFRAU_22800 [Arthrobacter sp. NPDC056691]|uniref:hypothetical protein n=1 Tax=Arthrobacter sp. NPDC056691 TaxID=3345913 RepID=UPI003672BFBC